MRITNAMGKNKPMTNSSARFMGSPSSASAVVSERVRWHILRRATSSARQQLEHLAWRFGWRWPWAYALLLEVYRILPRIRFVLTALQVDRDREMSAGPACHLERDGCHPKCNRTHARIRGIREQETINPWIGRFEVYLFFRGWNAAERFLAGSSCTESGRENKLPQPSLVSTNSQEVPAPSKCDLSTPPASRVELEGIDERGRNCTTTARGYRLDPGSPIGRPATRFARLVGRQYSAFGRGGLLPEGEENNSA
jgi:hypothetical protein